MGSYTEQYPRSVVQGVTGILCIHTPLKVTLVARGAQIPQ